MAARGVFQGGSAPVGGFQKGQGGGQYGAALRRQQLGGGFVQGAGTIRVQKFRRLFEFQQGPRSLFQLRHRGAQALLDR